MKIIHRYVLRETLVTFGLFLFSFTFILLVGNLFRFVDLVLNKGLPALFMVKLLVFLSPSLLVLTLPMAQLVATIVTYSRMNGDQEIFALKTTGYSLGQLFFPNLFLAFLLVMATFYLTLIGIPKGNALLQQELIRALSMRPYFAIREKVFYTDIEGLVLYVHAISPSGDLLQGIFLSDSRETDASLTITAEEGRISINPDRLVIVVDLKNGTIHRLDEERGEYQWVQFDQYTLSVPMKNATLKKEKPKRFKEMMVEELWEQIRTLRNTRNEDTSTLIKALIEFHQKFSLPLVPLLLGIIGPALGILNRHAGRSGGLLMGMVLILLYYVIHTTGETLSIEGGLSPLLAVWLPNLFLIALAVSTLYWARKDSSLEIKKRITNLVQRFSRQRHSKKRD